MDFKLHRIAVPVALLVPLSAFVYFQLQQDNSASSVELVINDHSDQTRSADSTISSSTGSSTLGTSFDSSDTLLDSSDIILPKETTRKDTPTAKTTTASFNGNIQQLQQLTQQSRSSLASQKAQHADQLIAQTDLLLAGIGLKPPYHRLSRTPSDTDKKQVAATERLLRLQQIQ